MQGDRVRLLPRNRSPLLATESAEQFEALRAKFWHDLKPRNEIERIYCEDFVSLVWDGLRLRRWKVAILNLAFGNALRELLIDKLYEFESGQKTVAYLDGWFADERVRRQISEILAKYGLDESVIEAEAFRQCSAELTLIEQLLAAAESRRAKLLHCIGLYREGLAQQLRGTTIDVIQNETRPPLGKRRTAS